MRRIYFLLPNVESAKGIIDELLLKRVEWRHIHVLARPDVPLEDLPAATLAQLSGCRGHGSDHTCVSLISADPIGT
ncbi:hypothetical protein OKW38_001951 [Paraburkholderia sp. MM5496-R1]